MTRFKLRILDEAVCECPDRRVFDLEPTLVDNLAEVKRWRDEARMWEFIEGVADTSRGHVVLRALTALTVRDWPVLRATMDEIEAWTPEPSGPEPT